MAVFTQGALKEVVEKAQKEIDKDIDRAGEDAVREVGVVGLVPKGNDK